MTWQTKERIREWLGKIILGGIISIIIHFVTKYW